MAGLPAQLTSFIGREDEINRILEWLDSSRLLTLTGPGGVGKTRLALVMAEQAREHYPDGVHFVALASLKDPTLVPTTIATSLDLELGNRSPEDRLASVLANQCALLILDNFEPVIEAATFVSGLLVACPTLTVLVTSQAPLHVTGEQQFPVRTLDLPIAANPPDLEQITGSEAVELFVERARASKPDFELTAGNAATVAGICRRLEGLPLAIELAAVRLKHFTPRELLDRLERRLPLLTTGARDVPARQQTMRDTIAWSYELLMSDQQRLLRQLSVLAGGWTLETADAVCDADLDVLDGLTILLEHSLVQLREQPDGTSRYTMLGMLREFGLEQLDEHGETDDIYERLARYLLDRCENARGEWINRNRRDITTGADAEIDNVRSALTWAVQHDPDLAVALTASLQEFWHLHSYYREAQQWLERALTNERKMTLLTHADALRELGTYAATLGDYAAGTNYLEESLALFREHDRKVGVAHCLFQLSRIAMWNADFERAEELLEDYSELRNVDPELSRELPNKRLGNLGTVLVRRGKFERAAAVLDEALDIARGSHDAFVAVVLTQRGYLSLQQRDLEDAYNLIAESLRLQHDVRDIRFAVHGLEVAAWILAVQRQPQCAARLLGAVDGLRESIGVPVPPMIQLDYNHYLPIAREHVRKTAWDAAWAEGRAMSLDAAIEYALEMDGSTEPRSAADLGLSKREGEVLSLLADGRSNQEIAAALFISPSTVANHVTNILTKLDLDSRTAAAIYAVRHDLV